MSFLRNRLAWFHQIDAVAAAATKESLREGDTIIARPQILWRRIRKREQASSVRVREEILKMVSAEKRRDAPFDPFVDSAEENSPRPLMRQPNSQSGGRGGG